MERMQNLYGKLPLDEAELLEAGLIHEANIHKLDLFHPDDKVKGFDPENPLANICDLGTAVLGLIYGGQDVGAIKERLWVFLSEEIYLRNKNKKFDKHYDYRHPKYKRIDLTRCQFPAGYFIVKKSENHGFTFNSKNRIPERMKILLPGFLAELSDGLGKIKNPTPELVMFVNHAR